MTHDIRIEQRAGHPLAVVRLLARPPQLSSLVPKACGVVWDVIRAQGIVGAGRHVAVYLDGQINAEVGVELKTPCAGHGDVMPSATPAGLVAVTTHLGPYGGLREAHQAIVGWCAKNGYVPVGPCWEIYGHWQEEWTRDSSRISTEVCYLVRPDGDDTSGSA